MDYNKLKLLIKSKKIQIKDFASSINYSPQGFQKAIENKTLTESMISKLCDLLSITPNEWFGFYSTANSHCQLCEEKDKRIAVMEDYILQLKDEVSRLKGEKAKKAVG